MHTREVLPSEMVGDALARRAQFPHDNLVWLETERDLAAAAREQFFKDGDKVNANHYDKQAMSLANAAEEMRRLREANSLMKDVIVRRVISCLPRE